RDRRGHPARLVRRAAAGQCARALEPPAPRSLAVSALPTPLARPGLSDPPLVRFGLIALAMLFLGLFVVTPLVLVFAQALSSGIGAYLAAITEPVALSAIRLTLLVAAIAVPLNLVFGIAAAWLIAKFNFAGKSLLTS